jgi:predicted metalloprotease with PDZ domain
MAAGARLVQGIVGLAAALLLAVGSVRIVESRGLAGRDTAPRRISAAYSLRLDAAHLDVAEVTLRLTGAPDTVFLAMKVHPEYDARYWRFVDSMRVDRSADDRRALVTRADSTLWRVVVPGGHGTVRWLVHIQPAPATRRAWMPFASPAGALVNPTDFFLYLADFTGTPVTLTLDVPRDWRAATSLARTGGTNRYAAPDAAALLDAPIMLGSLREWSFSDRGTTFHVHYLPLPAAAQFDTAVFVDGLRRLTSAALDLFGRAPTRDYHFLIEDGAGDALEHRASVTIGVPSAVLAANPRDRLTEIAHEFFHTWNLVAIHPDDYGVLSYRPPRRTSGLWWGEGVTIHYADVLPRRAGIAPATPTRLEHLVDRLTYYYAASWNGHTSPESSSLAFGDSRATNPDATGSYYLQGELLAEALDGAIRESTREARGLDDVMRAQFRASRAGRGFSSSSLEATVDSVCVCRLDHLFATQVRGPAPIDLRPALARLGLALMVDTVPAIESAGKARPRVRVADLPMVSSAQRARRARWLAGW